eukprot:2436781-Rhodomonas_salina.1
MALTGSPSLQRKKNPDGPPPSRARARMIRPCRPYPYPSRPCRPYPYPCPRPCSYPVRARSVLQRVDQASTRVSRSRYARLVAQAAVPMPVPDTA